MRGLIAAKQVCKKGQSLKGAILQFTGFFP